MKRDVDFRAPGDQDIQAAEYAFPYHYIPQIGHKIFFSRHWGFAASYLAAIELVAERLRPLVSKKGNEYRHIDIGCGDGALMYFPSRHSEFQSSHFFGVDSDQRAINWARMFNPTVNFLAGNITDVEGKYDSCTLIEVLEHIPPGSLPRFIENATRTLYPGGLMVITVPSIEKPLIAKHFQHFSFDSVREILQEYFTEIEISGFEKHNVFSRLVMRALHNSVCRIDMPRLNRIVVDQLRQLHSRQKGCGRLLVTCRR